jgi:hypothetical protein
MKRIALGIFVSMVLLLGEGQSQQDSSKAKPIAAIETSSNHQNKITFPELTERLFILAIALIALGGLGVLLNEKRKRADDMAGIR